MNKKVSMLTSLTPTVTKTFFEIAQMGSVARLEVSARDFNWKKPYQKGNSYLASGSASLINLPDQSESLFLLTAFHVVENAQRIWSTFANVSGELYETKIVGACPEMDVALLKIDSLQEPVKEKLKKFNLGDSDKLRVQQPVAAAGFPLAQNTVTVVEGVLSGMQETHLQTTVPINSGNSGGPLIDLETGNVIGVVVSSTKNAAGMNYAVPMKQILTHLQGMLNGFTRLPSFNFLTCLATPTLMQRFQCPPGLIGSFVLYVFPKSPLYKAGMRSGDIFTALYVNDSKDKYSVNYDDNITVPWWTSPVTIEHIEQRLHLNETVAVEFWSVEQKQLITAPVILDKPNLKKIRYYYKQFEKPEYEVFGGLVVMQLTENHIDYDLPDDDYWSSMFTYLQTQESEKEWEPILVITDILAESSLRALVDKTISVTDVLTHVNGVRVKTVDEYRKALRLTEDYITWQTRDGIKTVLSVEIAKAEYEEWRQTRKKL